jgi:hypothetical protein
MKQKFSRRGIIRVTTALVVAQASDLGIASSSAQKDRAKGKRQNADHDEMPDVTPPEDLMREHGVLNRVLLIYEAAMRKFAANESFDASVIVRLAKSSTISSRTITSATRSSRFSRAFAKPDNWSIWSTRFINSIRPGGG